VYPPSQPQPPLPRPPSPSPPTAPPLSSITLQFTLNMDYNQLAASTSALGTFQASFLSQVLNVSGLPSSGVSILSVAPGSTIVVAALSFPSQWELSQVCTSGATFKP
jgi:hypothetical protein